MQVRDNSKEMNNPSFRGTEHIKRQAVLGFGWVAGMKFGGQIVSWLSTIVVIRLLTPEDYGLMAMANVSLGIMMTLSSAGLSDGIIQQHELGQEQIQKVFGVLILSNLLFFVTQYGLATFLADYYEEPRIQDLAKALAFVFLLAPFISIPQALTIRDLEFKKNSIVFFIANLIGVATSLAMAWTGYGVWALVVGSIANNVIQAIGLQIIKPTIIIPRFNFSGMKRIFYFGGAVTLSSLVWSIYIRADIFIAGRVFDTMVVGVYATAIELSTMTISKIMPLISQVAFPVFAKIQSDRKLVISSYRKGMLVFTFLSFPIFLGIASVSPEFVPLFLGDHWIGVIDPLIILSFSIPSRASSLIFATVLKGLGRADVALANTFFSMIILIVAFLIMVHWGAMGMALAWLFASPITFAFTIFTFSKAMKLSKTSIIKDFYPAFLLSGIMFLVVRICSTVLVTKYMALKLAFLILVGAAAYLLSCYLMFRTKIDECLTIIKLAASRHNAS